MAFLSNKIKLKRGETKLLECPSLTILTHSRLADYMWSLKGVFIWGKLFLNMILQDKLYGYLPGCRTTPIWMVKTGEQKWRKMSIWLLLLSLTHFIYTAPLRTVLDYFLSYSYSLHFSTLMLRFYFDKRQDDRRMRSYFIENISGLHTFPAYQFSHPCLDQRAHPHSFSFLIAFLTKSCRHLAGKSLPAVYLQRK